MSDYFNTGDDSRFVFLENYLKGLLEKAKSKKVPGIRRDALINFIERVLSLVRELRWSYLPKNEMANSKALSDLENLSKELLDLLDEKGRELKSKDPLFFSELKFIGLSLKNLRERILNLPDKQVSAVDVVYVKIVDVEKHPKGENLLVTYVTDGSRNYRVVTNDRTVKSGEIVPLAILPPREFLGVVSEGMFVGGREGIRRIKEEEFVGKRADLSEDEENSVVKEIFSLLK